MKQHIAYTGKLDGVSRTICDKVPEGFEVLRQDIFYQPDEDKVFTKDGELFDCVVLKDGESIDDYVEIIRPKIDEPSE